MSNNPTLLSWEAGFVRRWHTNIHMVNTCDYDSGHQHRCLMLLMSFWPDSSRDLILAVAYHDQGEFFVGDMARPAKQRNPKMAEEMWELEKEGMSAQGFKWEDLSDEDQNKLKFVDVLDSWLWVGLHKPSVLSEEAWQKQEGWLHTQSYVLGVSIEYKKFVGIFSRKYIN